MIGAAMAVLSNVRRTILNCTSFTRPSSYQPISPAETIGDAIFYKNLVASMEADLRATLYDNVQLQAERDSFKASADHWKAVAASHRDEGYGLRDTIAGLRLVIGSVTAGRDAMAAQLKATLPGDPPFSFERERDQYKLWAEPRRLGRVEAACCFSAWIARASREGMP